MGRRMETASSRTVGLCGLVAVLLLPAWTSAEIAMSISEKEMSSFTCGDTTSSGEFNFVSPAYPVSVGLDNLTCRLTIDHGCPLTEQSSVCQLRLDFSEMVIQPPLLGTCRFDKFYVNANGRYPLLCGENTDHHMYLDVAGRASTDINMMLSELQMELYECPDKFGVFEADPVLRKLTDAEDRQSDKHPTVQLTNPDQLPKATFPTRRAWKIKVTQVPCGCSETPRAPDGCLQYYQGISGTIKSFNYDHVGCFSNDHICEANKLEACDIYAGYTGQLNNLDYTVCIQQEYGFCGTEYYQASEPGSFTLTNSTDLNENFQNMNAEGSDNGSSCNADYILLPGGHCKNDRTHYSTDRFCGNALGVNGMRQPIISYSRPFLFRVKTDSDELTSSIDYMNRGFHLHYHQLPCSASV